MLVKGQTWTAEIPHEPGETMTFRRLSWVELEAASKARRKAALDEFRGMADLIEHLPKSDAATPSGDDYDQGAVLRASIIGWTYEAEVSPEAIGELDTVTARWAYDQIVEAHRPRTEVERKNG